MPKANNVLIVTYYWPPSGNVGTYRWLHHANEFAKLGVNTTIFKPQNPFYETVDKQLNSQVHPCITVLEHPILEPNRLFAKLSRSSTKQSMSKSTKRSLFQRLSLFVRANYFIPDARMLWIHPSVGFLQNQIEQFDTIITTGPPHSCHLIGMQLKQKHPQIQWIADFRDPWLEIDYFNQLPINKKSLQKHISLEKKVLQTADAVTTVSPSWKSLLESKGAKQVFCFTNGYRKEDFAEQKSHRNKTFTIRHMGTLSEDRNPKQLWSALRQSNEQVSVECYGDVAHSIHEEVKNIKQVSIHKQVHHQKAIELMQSADALLLCNSQLGANKGRIPAKLFEYLGAKKPIIYIGKKNNDAYDVLTQLNAGICYEYKDQITIKELLTMENRQRKTIDSQREIYERSTIAKRFCEIF